MQRTETRLYSTASYCSLIILQIHIPLCKGFGRLLDYSSFLRFANSLCVVFLPNLLSQMQVCLRSGCCQGCPSGSQRKQRNYESGSIQPSNCMETERVIKASPFSGVISPCRILALCSCCRTENTIVS